MTPLLKAIKELDFEKTKQLLNTGMDINTRDTNGGTLLLSAVDTRNINLLEFLIMRGADINIRSTWGSPLTLSAMSGNNDLINLLLNHKAEINLRAYAGRTALHCAASGRHLKTTELLIKAKADASIRDSFHQQAIDMHFDDSDSEDDDTFDKMYSLLKKHTP